MVGWKLQVRCENVGDHLDPVEPSVQAWLRLIMLVGSDVSIELKQLTVFLNIIVKQKIFPLSTAEQFPVTAGDAPLNNESKSFKLMKPNHRATQKGACSAFVLILRLCY